MTDYSTHHDTIVFERVYDAPVQRVYAAFADPIVRAEWGAPSDTAVIIYDEADFRIGGRDVSRCGVKDDPTYRAQTYYLDIVPNRRIVSSEAVDELGDPLGASIVTLELESDGAGTRIRLTVQVASFGGTGMIEGTRIGYAGSLENLRRFVECAT